jgi:hypothetical protein
MAISNYKVLGQITSGTYERLPVNSRGLTTNQAYVGTPVPHGLALGDRYEVWSTDQTIMNRRRVVAKLGKQDDTLTTTFITSSLTNANIADAASTTGYLYKYANGQGKQILNKQKTSGIATLITNGAHGAAAGDLITVDINDGQYDGDFTIYDIVSSSAFRYIALGADQSSASVIIATAPGAVAIQKALTVFTVDASAQAIISTLSVANTLNHSCYFNAYIVPSGLSKTSPPDRTIIANRIALDPGETYSMTMGYTLDQGDALVVRASHAGTYFTAFGTLLR